MVSPLTYLYFVDVHRTSHDRVTRSIGRLAIVIPFRYKAALFHLMEYQIVKNGSKRRSWTTSEVRTLKSLARKKTHAGKIAKALKRTEGATRQKAFSLGLSLDARV
jgi:hypothetical protein